MFAICTGKCKKYFLLMNTVFYARETFAVSRFKENCLNSSEGLFKVLRKAFRQAFVVLPLDLYTNEIFE